MAVPAAGFPRTAAAHSKIDPMKASLSAFFRISQSGEVAAFNMAYFMCQNANNLGSVRCFHQKASVNKNILAT